MLYKAIAPVCALKANVAELQSSSQETYHLLYSELLANATFLFLLNASTLGSVAPDGLLSLDFMAATRCFARVGLGTGIRHCTGSGSLSFRMLGLSLDRFLLPVSIVPSSSSCETTASAAPTLIPVASVASPFVSFFIGPNFTFVFGVGVKGTAVEAADFCILGRVVHLMVCGLVVMGGHRFQSAR